MQAHTITSDGGHLFAGVCNFGTNFGGDDVWLRRLNASGAVVWERIIGGEQDDSVTHVLQLSNGDFVLGGYSSSGMSGTKSSTNYGQIDAWIVGIDSGGNQLWDVSIGTGENDFLRAVEATSDGVLCGVSAFVFSPNSSLGNKSCPEYGYGDFWVIKLSTRGTIAWQACFGGSSIDYLHFIRQVPSGGFLLAGTSESPPNGNKTSPLYGFENFWCVRIDANGNKLWDKTYGAGGELNLTSAIIFDDGGAMLVGSSSGGIAGTKTSQGYGSDDYWMVRIDSNGQQLWDASFGGSSGDTPATAERLSDGGYLIAGSSVSPASGNKTAPFFGGFYVSDYWIVRVAANGEKLWDRSFGGGGDDRLVSAQQTKDGAFILCGGSASAPGGNRTSPLLAWYDAWIVRVSATGEKLWDRSYGLPISYPMYYASKGTASQTPDGGFILFGDTNNDTDYYESWAVKLAPEQPILSPLRQVGNGFRFALTGTSNSYVVEYSTDLRQWLPLSTNLVTVTGDKAEILDTMASANPARAYRARSQN